MLNNGSLLTMDYALRNMREIIDTIKNTYQKSCSNFQNKFI